ncbi:MAG: MFS transporter [Candidatus Dormibacteraeota bacterium]|uniref:MFS transporter n=1 Tax=Candidatus Dormiibacter inghamiae TaxID=3127013 RepID=A0A934ND86_9BACT|nr:MFS transporter [Candidatus Dormibacteraeota bacterium]MBJ7606690.1 MFS transporter [Candidatus Dormibacteraeota bacterium]
MRRIHYAWAIAAVTFIALMGAAGFRSTPGVLIVPLESEFGWSRALISGAVSINLILFGLTGPFAAALMERFGMRKVVVAALALVATGSLLTVYMTAPWQLYLLWGLVVGLGTGTIASVLAATVASRWFVKRRGLVLGALTAAGATGQLIFLPFLGWLAQNVGWRWSAICVGVAAFAVVPLVALILRNRPADMGLLPYGGTEAEPVGPAVSGGPIRNAFRGLRLGVRSRDFWLLAGSFFICGASTNGLIGTHLIPASMDHGLAEVTAASLLAVIGVFDVIGTLASGYLTDRFDSRRLLFWYYALRGLSLLFLPYALGSRYFGLVLFIVFYGLDWVATVPPTVQLARRVFGPRDMPVVYGWIFASHQLGAASAAFAAGAVRTFFGDYQLAFMSSGLLCLVAAGLVLRVSRSRWEPQGLPAPIEQPAFS